MGKSTKPYTPEYSDPTEFHRQSGIEGKWRDNWWSDDFLRFLFHRWNIQTPHQLLDVGCGAGHWGRRIRRCFDGFTHVVGVDIKERHSDLSTPNDEESFEFQIGSADSLPYDDDSFDIVTCHKLLVQVTSVEQTLNEMIRVLRPGGYLIAAEPENLGSTASLLNIHPRPSREQTLAILELRLVAEEGRIALGEGDSSIGGQLPGLLRKFGLRGIQVSVNEYCPLLVPPYDQYSNPVQLEMELECARSGSLLFIGSRNDSRRHYLAGGGSEESFNHLWSHVESVASQFDQGIAAQDLYGARGQIFYIVSGCKIGA